MSIECLKNKIKKNIDSIDNIEVMYFIEKYIENIIEIKKKAIN